MRTWYILGYAGWAETKWVKDWVKHTKDTVMDVATKEKVAVQYIERSVFRLTLERDHYEVYKVLAGGIRIFKEFAHSEWKEINKERIDVIYRKANERTGDPQ